MGEHQASPKCQPCTDRNHQGCEGAHTWCECLHDSCLPTPEEAS